MGENDKGGVICDRITAGYHASPPILSEGSALCQKVNSVLSEGSHFG
jgi:hypothetical protein